MAFDYETIESEYRRLNHRLGWRLFTCPAKNISKAKVTLITINPGGQKYEQPQWSKEEGSAYVLEHWKGNPPGQEKLQRQVQRMLQIVGTDPNDVLSGYLVPFRSRSWHALPEKKASLNFGVKMWVEIFENSNANLILAFGKEVAGYIVDILDAHISHELNAAWGSNTIDVYTFGNSKRLVVLPHLSRFRLFGRVSSENAFRDSLNA